VGCRLYGGQRLSEREMFGIGLFDGHYNKEHLNVSLTAYRRMALAG
jgi:hypothetical protein